MGHININIKYKVSLDYNFFHKLIFILEEEIDYDDDDAPTYSQNVQTHSSK